jgi:preprotein translocase subunit SecD
MRFYVKDIIEKIQSMKSIKSKISSPLNESKVLQKGSFKESNRIQVEIPTFKQVESKIFENEKNPKLSNTR